jgi:excisionase family DNA binding protein
MHDELLDKNQARAALGGIGTTKFYALLNEKKIAGVKIGKRLMVRRSEINRYIASLPAYNSQSAGA